VFASSIAIAAAYPSIHLPAVEMLLDHLETALKGTIYEADADRHLVEVELFEGMDNKTRTIVSCKPISNLVGKSWISIMHS
jgi:hypothetical protein